jgi:FAD:protein FMN transferase
LALLRPLIVLGLVAGSPILETRIPTSERPTLYEFAQVHMGLPVRLHLYAQNEKAARMASASAFSRIAELDRMMSDYRPDSELRRLASNGDWTVVSPELFDVLKRAVLVARETGGAFDPTIAPLVSIWREARATERLPARADLDAARRRVGWRHLQFDERDRAVRLMQPDMRLDLGGIAKGYILQEARRILHQHGVAAALVEAGGDIVAGNAPPGREGWRIDVGGAGGALEERAGRLVNAALATSGPTAQFVEIEGVRYSHVIDPRTGVGVTNDLVARVIAEDAATADALATALTVIGSIDSSLLSRFPGTLASLDSR